MAHILKRSLFIGLGGTGAQALLHTKKRFLDTYGEVPPMIGFLAIDTDVSTGDKTITRDNVLDVHKNKDFKVSFTPSEVIHIGVQGAASAYEKNKDTIFSWMPQENEYALKNLWQGAGQVRTNGRFGTYFNQKAIMHAVQNKINAIQNIDIANQNTFVPKDAGIEINFVFSIAGGTGSGTFIDIVYLVKHALEGNENIKSIGFAVLPDVFNAMQQGISMANTRPNSYGALVDLDFLMSKDIEKFDLTINLNQQTIPVKEQPFDILFTIGNKNTNGAVIDHISDISEQIGLAMFTGASELSANVNSVYDNVITVLVGGQLDVFDKRAWACGMGVSELYYDGNTLSNIYTRRLSQLMINNLLRQDESAQPLANTFIDNPEVNIRENNGNDNLINSLLNNRPQNQFPYVDDLSDILNQINAYLTNLEETSEKNIVINTDNKFQDVKEQLKNFVLNTLNDSYGVGNTKHFLEDLKHQLTIFFNEMEEEEAQFIKNRENNEQAIRSEVEALQGMSKGFSFLKKSAINDSKETLSDMVNNQAITINEIKRRVYAKQFLTKLISEVVNYQKVVDTVGNKLKQVQQSLTSFVNNIINSTNERQKTFIIDLHKLDLDKTYAREDEFLMSDFMAILKNGLDNGLLDFETLKIENIEKKFWKYAKDLPKSKEFVNKSIDDVLRTLTEEQTKDIANKLIGKSHALWQYSSKGFVVGQELFDYFVIGLPSANSQFKKAFGTLVQNQNIEYVATGIHNKVICYRMEAASPIYGVLDVEGYSRDHNKIKENMNSMIYHVDKNWLTEMQRRNFSIWPAKKEDNSLQAWVLSFAYELIKLDPETNKYKIYSTNHGDPLDNYWLELSEYRDKAFEIFKRNKFVEEAIISIESRQHKEGEMKSNELIADMKNDYLGNYACVNISRDDLKKPHYQSIADLLKKEIDFVIKELK
ncbi:hypothetical protein HX045_11185 [Myroides odoratimimus]|uniref:Uncharacterized protein n=3 Tax=Myroides odoratimimus TaxID=76832 RepID=A0A0S7EBY0_9FLAO|nr:tubulin-like doman-containing protein [Myroides odoratimimus]ALU27943.1 hypothetical protein AS202_18100 [Myroides odoratimimus]EHO10311.1 hypothetical protein HMPREF9712_01416 [Myroides odoratimimus CCUG 10230]MCA4806940.1 hypothetical protein [Myroides odoratimimus]MCO7723362.1 hypothetical protein [Myroides odoratimimus]MDM1038620.1 hypothetical protein [Myroides odoratimimus]